MIEDKFVCNLESDFHKMLDSIIGSNSLVRSIGRNRENNNWIRIGGGGSCYGHLV